MNLSALLKKARKRKGLSQEELAERLNRARSCISKYENGSKVIDAQTFINWVKHTNATDLLVAALTGFDPLAVSEGLRIMATLMGGG